MHAIHLLLAATAAALFAAAQGKPFGVGAPATCACKLQYGGENPCCCSDLLVRPPPPVRPPRAGPRLVIGTLPGAQTFQPIGDSCCCDQIAVSPAMAPRPYCDFCAAKVLQRDSSIRTMGDEPPAIRRKCPCGVPNCDCCTCGTPGCAGNCGRPGCTCRVEGCAPDCGCFCHEEEPFDDCPGYVKPLPADPVSMSLAYNQLQKAKEHVREDALTFGFNQLPQDGPIDNKPKLRVQEEKLANWQAPVMELAEARPRSGCRAALEEEARDALLRAEQRLLEDALAEEADAADAAKPSLVDLGYRPATYNTPPFITEHGCAGISSSIMLPASAPSFPMPMPYPEGRVVALPYGDGESGGRYGRREPCDSCDDDDYSGELPSASSFVPVAPLPEGGEIHHGYRGTPYSEVLGLPAPSSCGSQLIDRIQSMVRGPERY